jgi:hypothetical protein
MQSKDTHKIATHKSLAAPFIAGANYCIRQRVPQSATSNEKLTKFIAKDKYL